MNNETDLIAVKRELDRLTADFFAAVSFDTGEKPRYENLHELFIDAGLLIKNSGSSPEITTVPQFVAPRQALVDSGALTRFREFELSEATEIFGNVAHRFSAYAKSGELEGVAFEARGLVSTQFVRTSAGWKMSAMAWDDERPGLSIGDHHYSSMRNAGR
jgi:hypothetical protein